LGGGSSTPIWQATSYHVDAATRLRPSTAGVFVENLKQIEVSANGEVVFGDVVS
jgi:hypothetical protein